MSHAECASTAHHVSFSLPRGHSAPLEVHCGVSVDDYEDYCRSVYHPFPSAVPGVVRWSL